MNRLLVCLVVLLFFALLYPLTGQQPAEEKPAQNKKTAAAAEGLPDTDVVRFLEKAIERYDREVTGFRCILTKQERVQGQLKKREVVEADFREKPFSVFMKWREGSGMARAVLYVEGQNNDRMVVRPTINVPFFPVFLKPVDGTEAKSSGRYTIDEFGIKIGMVRVLDIWKKQQKAGKLEVTYEGIYKLEHAGGRKCYKIHRTSIDPPEDDNIADVVLYFDTETWLQLGTVLRNPDGELVGEYYWNILERNPKFDENTFSRKRVVKS